MNNKKGTLSSQLDSNHEIIGVLHEVCEDDSCCKLKLISKKKDLEGRFHYYKLTKLGENIVGRWDVKFLMDELVPDEAVAEIAMKIGEIMVKYDIDDLPISKKPNMIL